MAEALYRKYRPQVFEDVVGQEHIERTLKNAIDQGKVSHAYLFCGPRGTGKTTTARLLAKALLCEHGPTSSPDGTCQSCVDIAEGYLFPAFLAKRILKRPAKKEVPTALVYLAVLFGGIVPCLPTLSSNSPQSSWPETAPWSTSPTS